MCHTDLHAAHGDWPVKPTPPFIPGHEGTGYVAAVGAGVKHVKEGDRVGVPWLHTACGCCSPCRTGWETLCAEQQNTGYSVNGSFAEYGLADPNFVGHLPAGLDFGPAAPVLCAGVTVYKGLKETEVRPGEWVVISGIGGLGHMAVQYAKAMGMNVAAVDVEDDKLELAKKLGASVTVNAKHTDPAAYLPAVYSRWQGIELMNYSPLIYAYGAHDVAVTGNGILDGQASAANWWAWKKPGYFRANRGSACWANQRTTSSGGSLRAADAAATSRSRSPSG